MSNIVSCIPKVFKVPWDFASPKTDTKICHLLWHVFMGYCKKKGERREKKERGKEVKIKAAGTFSFDFTSTSPTQKNPHLTKQPSRSI